MADKTRGQKRTFCGREIKSAPGDTVTVAVGRGEDLKEFVYSKATITSAVPHIDRVLAHKGKKRSDRRIEFPQYTSSQWEAINPFIVSPRSANLDENTANDLAGIFYYLQMVDLVKECDDLICTYFIEGNPSLYEAALSLPQFHNVGLGVRS